MIDKGLILASRTVKGREKSRAVLETCALASEVARPARALVVRNIFAQTIKL